MYTTISRQLVLVNNSLYRKMYCWYETLFVFMWHEQCVTLPNRLSKLDINLWIVRQYFLDVEILLVSSSNLPVMQLGQYWKPFFFSFLENWKFTIYHFIRYFADSWYYALAINCSEWIILNFFGFMETFRPRLQLFGTIAYSSFTCNESTIYLWTAKSECLKYMNNLFIVVLSWSGEIDFKFFLLKQIYIMDWVKQHFLKIIISHSNN